MQFPHWLEKRVATDPARPLLVWYGPGDERVELSATTFANWVDKTVNMLGDLGWEDQPRVALCLLDERPAHWTTLVWVAAVWQLGGVAVPCPPREVDAPDLAVVGPSHPHPIAGMDTIACSLHPLGAGFSDLPRGLIDYREVLGQPDVHTPAQPVDPDSSAWVSASEEHRHAELEQVTAESGRVLVVAEGLTPWQVVCRALVGPLRGGGSAVVVEGRPEPERVERIAQTEKVS
ncbi:TIGR03089 family protein [Aestuariimicrobium sp. p3-SID1156]|uniref:TIGR03089 family protein n=1 Tax=Aestuariimicrobium sp. p3-SID1156 TaxID=2916038 RepID=UPI00223BBCE9|nr:TIGR03089 family protein [Aestuariimicrobium sp. p3-SID1156]MCT1460005.1 TIGR03089 family protein [Aestuariimicrobium sp. p3-SID1156]